MRQCQWHSRPCGVKKYIPNVGSSCCKGFSKSSRRAGTVSLSKPGKQNVFDVDCLKPIGEWKSAWKTVCKKAGVKYRWHDLRHTFISRLAENPNVSEQTIREMAGHVSKEMMQRYSHIRIEAKKEAVASLEKKLV